MRKAASVLFLLLIGACALPQAAAHAFEESATVQEHAAEAYARENGVSHAVALQRLELQDRVMPVAGAIQAALGDSNAGIWFDPQDDGRLKIATTPATSRPAKERIERSREILRDRGIAGDAEFVVVPNSLEDLERALRAINARLTAGQRAVTARVAIDVQTNELLVDTPTGLASDDRRLVEAAISDVAVEVRARTLPARAIEAAPKSCNLPNCESPLRGGVEIYNNWSGCTLGFNATSRSDGRPYALTAGHCLEDTSSPLWWASTNFHDEWALGTVHNWVFPGENDAGIITVKADSYWSSPAPAPWVAVDAGPSTTYDPAYEIYDEGTPVPGLTVCTTSAVPFDSNDNHTRCGTITHTDISVSVIGAGPLHHQFSSTLCIPPGSSGGPVYKGHLAYGLNTAGDVAPCWDREYAAFHNYATRSENAMNVNIKHAPPQAHPDVPHWYLKNSHSTGHADVHFTYGSAGDVPLPGDWNNDGVDTPGVVHGNVWYLRNSNTTGFGQTSFTYGDATGMKFLTGDWNNDGVDTPAAFKQGTWYLRHSHTTGTSDLTFDYGTFTTSPVPLMGDWNGDGIDTPGVRLGNTWYLRNSNSTGVSHLSFNYGSASGHYPLVGDWDGNGTDTPGVYDTATRTFYLRNSNTTGTGEISFQYGNLGDRPIVGDWNGDGVDTVGVVREAPL